jgi:hypothetical protein
LNATTRFKVVACGRRFGKTEIGKIMLIDRVLLGWRCWWLAPTYGMTAQIWRDFKSLLTAPGLPLPGIEISERDHRIDLPGGGMLAIRSTHYPDHLRGEGLDFAVLDEAAFMLPHVWSEVVRPMLLERQGGAAFLSSPRGHNWFWDLYRLGLDPQETDWSSFHFTSYENPLVPASEIDALKTSTPERVFQEEYMAKFLTDTGEVFRGIQQVATAPLDAIPLAGRRYVAGIDWGREHDYTCIVVIDADTQTMVAFDRFNKIGWDFQRERLQILCDHWQPVAVWAEANSIGSPNIEALQAEGLPVRAFQTTISSKPPLIEGLALAIERGELQLMPDAVLFNELAAYTVERLPGGGHRYTAPRGGHDDTVIALALAWHGVKYGGGVDFA